LAFEIERKRTLDDKKMSRKEEKTRKIKEFNFSKDLNEKLRLQYEDFIKNVKDDEKYININ